MYSGNDVKDPTTNYLIDPVKVACHSGVDSWLPLMKSAFISPARETVQDPGPIVRPTHEGASRVSLEQGDSYNSSSIG